VNASRWRTAIGAVLIVAGSVLIAGSLALHAWGSTVSLTSGGSAPALSAAEQSALRLDRTTVQAVPQALREVPVAMAAASGSALTRTQAGEILFEHPELGALLRAIEHPGSVTGPLAEGLFPSAAQQSGEPLLPVGTLLLFFVGPGVVAIGLGLALRSRKWADGAMRVAPVVGVIAGLVVFSGVVAPIDHGTAAWHALDQTSAASRSVVNSNVVEADLGTLEQVYDDVVPALQLAGAAGRQVLDPQSAVAVLSAHDLASLDRFVTDFNRLYGAGVLISQQAASVPETPSAPAAMRWLVWMGLVSGALLIGAGVTAGVIRRRELASAAVSSTSDADVGSFALGSPR